MHWQAAFKKANHLERLAMLRNPLVDYELVEKIFDPEDGEFALNMEARGQLAAAYLTNEHALNFEPISYNEWCARIGTDDAFGYVDIHSRARTHFDKLWELASKWPAADVEFGIRYWVYRHIGAGDKTKAEVYRACKLPALRRAILQNRAQPVSPTGSSLTTDSTGGETIRLALDDDDAECRKLAAAHATPQTESKRKKYISYAWSVFWTSVPNAIAIVLALRILSSAATTFENIVFATLVLIYNGVVWVGVSHGFAASEQAVIGARRFLRTMELLKDPSLSEESKEAVEEPLRQQEKALRKRGVRLIAQSVWSLILTAIASSYLVRTLF
jgi:hypothetical protein